MVLNSQQTSVDDLLQRIGNKLELTPSQYKLAEERYQAIGKWLASDIGLIGRSNPVIYPQGSMRIGTTVKPIKLNEHDLDMVCELKISKAQTTPLGLMNALEERIKAHEGYRTMYERKKRCLRLNYANEFHLDIMPACFNNASWWPESVDVPDCELRDWKISNPRGFARWFEDRAASQILTLAKRVESLPDPEYFKPPLKRGVQLFKRWRDKAFNCESAPASIVLTTMAGEHFNGGLTTLEALLAIMELIKRDIDRSQGSLVVTNPGHRSEIFSEKWIETPEYYDEFCEKFDKFYEDVRGLLVARNLSDVYKTLERLFGEDLTRDVFVESGRSVAAKRESDQLAVDKRTGVLTGLSAVAIPVKPTVFYGDKVL